MASDLTPGDHVRIEGFDEPALLTLPNGDVLCFMRSGGRYDGRYSPLYLSRSADDGRTWSVADPIADRGVWPNACRLDNGVLAVIYGRPGDWLAFSLDDGHSWIGHFCLHLGPQPWDCGSYDWIEAVGLRHVPGGLRSHRPEQPAHERGVRHVHHRHPHLAEPSACPGASRKRTCVFSS